MSIERPASASRFVIPMSAAVLAVGESGMVWIPNSEPWLGTSRPVGRGAGLLGGVGAGGSTYGTVFAGVAAWAAGEGAPPSDEPRARAASAPMSNGRRAVRRTKAAITKDSKARRG